MAREVHKALIEVLSKERGITEQKAEEVIKSMRAASQYQVCLAVSSMSVFEVRCWERR